MKILLFFVTCVILALSDLSLSCIIKCDYGNSSPYTEALGHVYQCYIANDPFITSKELAQSCDIRGQHETSNTDYNVLGFYAPSKTINYFPQALSRTYQNIKKIVFQDCKMKEIHQSDLKPFPHLVFLSLVSNEIEVFEQGLFDYNPHLEYLTLSQSNIIHIHSNVFDHLNKLRWIYLNRASCLMSGSTVVIDSVEQVKKLVALVRSNCSNSEFLTLDNQLKNLENESQSLNCKDFATKMENFTSVYKHSKLSKTRTLNDKYLALMNSKECPNHQQMIKLITLDTKIGKIDENLSNSQKIILEKFENVTQCGLKNPSDEPKTSQNSIETSLNEISSSTTNHEIKLDQIQTRVMSSIDELTTSQKAFNKLQNSKLNKLQSDMKNCKSSDGNLSELQSKLQELTTSITDQIEENLENLEKKLEKNQKNFDSKLKSFENRLMDRFEKIEKALDLKIENN